jgi:hypothetical protein
MEIVLSGDDINQELELGSDDDTQQSMQAILDITAESNLDGARVKSSA